MDTFNKSCKFDESTNSNENHLGVDPWRFAKTEQAKQLIDLIFDMVIRFERETQSRRRARTKAERALMHKQIDVTITNLAYQVMTTGPCPLRVSRSNRVLGASDRYNRRTCLSKAYRRLLDALAAPEIGLITMTLGEGYNDFKKALKQTCIAPSGAFLDLLGQHQLSLDDFSRNFLGETIVLKSLKTHGDYFVKGTCSIMDYEDTPETITMREQMSEINEWLLQANIEFDEMLCGTWVDVTKKQLYRVFNNGTFEDGGRLYGGFWQYLTKHQRAKGLSINGRAIISLDYGQIAPRILYAMAGMVPDFEDAYAIPGLGPEWRKAIKKVTSSMLFVGQDPRKLAEDIRGAWPNQQVRLKDLVERIKSFHRPVSHLFCTKIGFKVFRMESNIMVAVLLKLKSQGIIGLPVHDCVIVEEQHEAIAREAMQEAFRNHLGFDAIIERE